MSVKLSNSTNSFSPALWPEWECGNEDSSLLDCADFKNLTLRLKWPASLPPLYFNLDAPGDTNDAYYAGSYTLESFNQEDDPGQFPVYSGPEDRKIYHKNGFWVLGDENKTDSIFKLSDSSTINPANWTEEGSPRWINTGATERPTLTLADPADLPTQQFSLVSIEEEDTTFYEGVYELQFFPVNGMPEYVCNPFIWNETSSYQKHLYVSSTKSFWVLGDADHNDYIFNISNKTTEFSPPQWNDLWQPTDSSTSAKPELVLNSAGLLPPWQFNLEPSNSNSDSDSALPLYAGTYTLNPEHLSPSKMPQFNKTRTSDDQDDVILYVSQAKDAWVLGTTDYSDYVFTISTNSSSKSPIDWHEWKRSSSSENPFLTLNDPTSLPPCTFQLLPNKTGDSPFYAGNYTLNLTDPYKDRFQYVKSSDETDNVTTLLYVNSTTGIWMLGDGGHKDYVFNLSSSTAISPANWSEWTNNGPLENPSLTKKYPFDLPPYRLTLSPTIGSDDTFYKGSYSLQKYADETFNERPQYKHDNNSNLLLYINSQKVWVLGDSDHKDFIFHLTGADDAFSPFQWQEWMDKNNSTSPETPTLVLRDPTFLPPTHLTLASFEDGDQAFYSGNYTLNVRDRANVSRSPIYSKHDDKETLLYVSESRNCWVLGNVDFEDYVFNISRVNDIESPVNWNDMWNNIVDSQEMPVMKLLDPLSLPPYNVTLRPNTDEDEPFYAGEYILNLKDEHNYHPYYSRNSATFNVTHLYVNNNDTGSIWILGDEEFTDYRVMALCSMQRLPPTWPSLWTECENQWIHMTETIESPKMKLVNATTLPPYKVTLESSFPENPDSPSNYAAGSYTLDITEFYNGFPQYSCDNSSKILYVARFPESQMLVWSTNNASERQEENDNGHPLSRSRNGTFSPWFWEEWDNSGSTETPVLKLKQSDFLAPSVKLLPESVKLNTTFGKLPLQNFFVGTFTLTYHGFNGYPVYRRSDPKAVPSPPDIYVFDNTWVLGYQSHDYSYLNLSSHDPFEFASPAQWDSSEWTLSQSGTEKPSLTITSQAAVDFFQDFPHLLLYLDISQEGIAGPDERDFTGSYSLDLTLTPNITNETFPQYVRDADSRLYVSSHGMWMHGDPDSLEDSYPISFLKATSESDDRLPTAQSPLGWGHALGEWKLNITSSVPILSLKYSHRSILYESLKTIPFHFFCMNEDGERTDLIKAPELLCSGLADCREVGEEASADEDLGYNDVDEKINTCPFYVNPTWWMPMLMAAAITLVGMLFFVVAGFFIDDSPKEMEARKFTQIEKEQVDRVNYVIATKIEEFQDKDNKIELTEIINFLHDSPGGMRLLIQTAFIYSPSLSKDTTRRQFSLFLWAEEERIHGKENRKQILKCIRAKGGSNQATGLYLDHKLKPEKKKYHVNRWIKNNWKSVKEKGSECVCWLESKAGAASPTRFLFKFGMIFLRIVKFIAELISKFLLIIFVLFLIMFEATDFEFDGFLNLELFCFILDMVKDFLFWLYLNSRIEYLEQGSLTIALINLQLATIVMAQALMGLFILMRADKVFNWKKERWKRILSYICLVNPIAWLFLPCTVVMKVSQLEGEKTRLIDNESGLAQPGLMDALMESPWYRDWSGKVKRHREKKQKRREKVESPAALCLRCRDIDDQAIILRSMAASFILVEGTLESTPQLMIMFVFLFPDGTGFRDVIIGDSIAIFILNTMFTVVSVFNAAISYANVMKREQLGNWQKLLLFLSASFQILTKLLPMIAMATAKNVRVTIVGLLLPAFFHWIIIGCIYICVPPLRVQIFSKDISRLNCSADLMIHLISNTFLATPLRSLSDEKQRHKSHEMKLLLAVNGLETVIIFFIGFGVFWEPDNPELQSAVRICWILSLFFFLLGSAFLVLYYKFAHTWRDLEREQLPFFSWLTTTPKETLEPAADNFGLTPEESSTTWEDWELNSQLDEEKKGKKEKDEKELENPVPEYSQVLLAIFLLKVYLPVLDR